MASGAKDSVASARVEVACGTADGAQGGVVFVLQAVCTVNALLLTSGSPLDTCTWAVRSGAQVPLDPHGK